MKKFILFDNDGVLVETEKWYYEANVKALKELNIHLELNRYLQIMARGGTAWELAFEEGVSKELVNKQREKRDLFYQDFLQTKNIEIKGVKTLLEELSKSYRMAIITTSRRVDFELIHKNRGIVDFMDFSLCVEEYVKAKPAPDPYLAGLKRFNAKKEEAIVVEDSQRGLSSAFNAGIECVIVHNEFTKTHDFTNASYHIKKLEELKELLSTL
ncbi:HAD family hydrolase [Halarcobacter bivalviorum]|uniref:phosphoglycolate phosphatase n=1 Tax=Halarcobacter bivalviorum TaxID=663364 RepID=A0AAX2A8Q4_9BACT|nr:HAD family phosphatase [Halarcobacter bivalviorum]AXH12747.1 beta-phosphoglucomutase-like HAD superfamily hydrolase [Halarcobacter bivalviorum]RXK10335.1 HAD family hydrolase [Halarcobacter bivalviorum]